MPLGPTTGAGIVTTGLIPLVTGSDEVFQLQAYRNGVVWDLTGGSATLTFTSPSDTVSSVSATIQNGGARAAWTVLAESGTWRRQWHVVDASGVRQVSRPIAFDVTN